MADKQSEHGLYSPQKPEVPAMGNYEAQRQLDYRLEINEYPNVISPSTSGKKDVAPKPR